MVELILYARETCGPLAERRAGRRSRNQALVWLSCTSPSGWSILPGIRASSSYPEEQFLEPETFCTGLIFLWWFSSVLSLILCKIGPKVICRKWVLHIYEPLEKAEQMTQWWQHFSCYLGVDLQGSKVRGSGTGAAIESLLTSSRCLFQIPSPAGFCIF